MLTCNVLQEKEWNVSLTAKLNEMSSLKKYLIYRTESLLLVNHNCIRILDPHLLC